MASKEITVPGKAARIRGATWTHDQVCKLFQVWSEPEIYDGLQSEKKKVDIFKKMASILSSQGVSRKWSEVRAKIKNLKADFRKALEKKSPFKYSEQMKKIMNMGGGPSTRPSKSPIYAHQVKPGPSFKSLLAEQDEPPAVEQSDSDDEARDEQRRSGHQSPPESHSSDDGEIISNKRSVIQSTPYHDVSQDPKAISQGHHEEHYHQHDAESYRTSTISSEQHDIPEEKAGKSHFLQTSPLQLSRPGQEYSQKFKPHDPLSRSSVTHVISNVIEPVTSIVMPSSSSTIPTNIETMKKSPHSIIEEADSSKSPQTPEADIEFQRIQTPMTPVRLLEFVVDDENIILHRTSSDMDLYEQSQSAQETEVPDFQQSSPNDNQAMADSPPLQPSIISVESRAIPQARKTHVPEVVSSPEDFEDIRTGEHETLPAIPLYSGIRRRQQHTKQTPPQTPIRRGPRTMKVLPPSHPKRKFGRSAPPPQGPSKKRKLLEALNKKTVDTISSLLTESSNSLLKQLEDSEQRFIKWEEERRNEERKREEQMFTKLIAAMKATSNIENSRSESQSGSNMDKESTNFVTNLKDISKRLNEMVSDEVKTTEESMRQWETKMQRQESRHTEKIFAMLINAIKRPDL